MTVNNEASSVTFTGNSITTVFPYTFRIPEDDMTHVGIFDIASSVLTELAPADYSITGVGSDFGGTVTYNPLGVPIPNTKRIVIYRELDLIQELDLTNQSPYYANTLEETLDRIVMMMQQVSEDTERALKVTLGSTVDPDAFIEDLLGSAAEAEASAAAAAASAAAAATFNPANYIANALLTTRGDLIRRGAAAPQRLALAAKGKTLVSNGVDALWGDTFTLAPAIAGGALTVALKDSAGNDPSATNPVLIPFRSVTPGSGVISFMEVTAPVSFTISSGSTMGFANAVPGRVWFTGIDDAGTFRIGAVNCLSGTSILGLREGILSATAEGGAGAADSAKVIYANAAVAAKSMVILGYMEWAGAQTLPAAGTWSLLPLINQKFGPGVSLPGTLVGSDNTDYSAVATGTTLLPFDDTIPQITEGDEYMTQTYTPLSACNILRYTAEGDWVSAANVNLTIALFRDAGVNALKTFRESPSGAGNMTLLKNRVKVLAASTAATTFRTRVGAEGAGTNTFNGVGGARMFGGTMGSYNEVEEFMA